MSRESSVRPDCSVAWQLQLLSVQVLDCESDHALRFLFSLTCDGHRRYEIELRHNVKALLDAVPPTGFSVRRRPSTSTGCLGQLSPVPTANDVGCRTLRTFGTLSLDKIIPDPDQPRTEFDEAEFEPLAQSIQDKGQLHPIRVRWSETHGKWLIISSEEQALEYYSNCADVADNDFLDPRGIRDWAMAAFPQQLASTAQVLRRRVRVDIVDPTILKTNRPSRVLPIAEEESFGWIDVAGYVLARSARHVIGDLESDSRSFDFVLEPKTSSVAATPYL